MLSTNRLPSTMLNSQTPFERWTGIKPNLSQLKIFGSIVYSHVPSEKRNKLEDRATKEIYVGYGDRFGKKGYCLYNESTWMFQFNRSCLFNENLLLSQFCNSHNTLSHKLPQSIINEDNSLDEPLDIISHVEIKNHLNLHNPYLRKNLVHNRQQSLNKTYVGLKD